MATNLLTVLLASSLSVSEAVGINCGCPHTCTSERLAETNGANHACGARIQWLMQHHDLPEANACAIASKHNPFSDEADTDILGDKSCSYEACHPEGCGSALQIVPDFHLLHNCGCPETCTDEVMNEKLPGKDFTCKERLTYMAHWHHNPERDACTKGVDEGYCDAQKCRPDLCGSALATPPPKPDAAAMTLSLEAEVENEWIEKKDYSAFENDGSESALRNTPADDNKREYSGMFVEMEKEQRLKGGIYTAASASQHLTKQNKSGDSGGSSILFNFLSFLTGSVVVVIGFVYKSRRRPTRTPATSNNEVVEDENTTEVIFPKQNSLIVPRTPPRRGSFGSFKREIDAICSDSDYDSEADDSGADDDVSIDNLPEWLPAIA